MLWGAVSFWAPKLALEAAIGGRVEARILTWLLPAAFCAAAIITAALVRHSPNAPSATIFMTAGLWLFGGVAILISATLAGAGYLRFTIGEAVVTTILSLVPVYTAVMSTYDGTLYALLITSLVGPLLHILLERHHWIVPPAIKVWFSGRGTEAGR
jgi:hypothetical protein